MMAAASEAERDAICRVSWEPAYADICCLPARTWRGLAVKLDALLDEHENGDGPHSEALRDTVREALARLNRAPKRRQTLAK